jgi:hypothetical protein
MQLRQRLENMQNAEKKKQDAIMKKQQIHAEALRQKRAAIEERIDQNMKVAEMMEEKKKQDFIERQENFEKIRLEALERQEEERRLKVIELLQVFLLIIYLYVFFRRENSSFKSREDK